MHKNRFIIFILNSHVSLQLIKSNLQLIDQLRVRRAVITGDVENSTRFSLLNRLSNDILIFPKIPQNYATEVLTALQTHCGRSR